MNHASLFSGIGGPEVAAAMLGWSNVFHCEINPFGRQVLEYWFPDSVSYEDITKTDFSQWRGLIDVLTGGFPCQPFSFAGKRGGDKDERYLWPEMLRAIDEIRPTWVVGENVAGVTTMVEGGVLTDMGCEATLFQEGDDVHGYSLEQTFTIERICRDLERAGYAVQPVLIPAAAVGAPHRRDRIFILARIAADSAGGGCAAQETCGRVEGSRRDGHVLPEERGLAAQRTDGLHPVSGSSEDPERHGCCQREHGIEGSQRDIGDAGAGDCQRVCGKEGIAPAYAESRCYQASESSKSRDNTKEQRQFGGGDSEDAPNTDCQRLQESQQSGRRENRKEERAGMDNRTERPCHNGDITNAFRKRLEAAIQRGCYDSEGRDGERRYAFQSSNDAWLEGTWWKYFPTQSPVHSGNDGISIRLDGITIPFNKWRTEALKAYGNAICVPVMYRIFQAIEEVER